MKDVDDYEDSFDCFESHFDENRKQCITCTDYENCKEEKIHYDRVLEIDRRKALEESTK